MSNNIQFLDLYAILEKNLKTVYKKNGGSIMIRHTEKLKKSYFYKDKERAKNLDSIRSLRNFLVHEADIVGSDAFTIHQGVLDFMREEIERIAKPIIAKEICTPLEQMNYATLESKVKDTIEVMIKKGYSHIPVLAKNNTLLGVFSANTLLAYAYHNPSLEIKPDSVMKDYFSLLNIEQHYNEYYLFVKYNTSIDDLIDIFEQRKIENKRISMLFVTRNGTATEKIMGLITPFDVIHNG